MNLAQLQAELRHFAAERDWQPFHTPKNLSTALMVEAAELAEIFQWMTPQQSQAVHQDPSSRTRIGEEVADVLLYLLQLADHSRVDIDQAIRDKLERNALKYPATRRIARDLSTRALKPTTHVLLDYENVQPTEVELRATVPDASHVWVFHGPHQRDVEQRFATFGAGVTAVPISRTGKNALDFHLSFYAGYIVARNPGSKIVVVANDKGYSPMIEHARSMRFDVLLQEHGRPEPGASTNARRGAENHPAARPAAGQAAPKQAPAKKAAVKQPGAKSTAPRKGPTPAPATKKAPAKKLPIAKKVAVKSLPVPVAANQVAVASRGAAGAARVSLPVPAAQPSPSADLVRKITDNLRKMDDKRPAGLASLRRALKSFLGAETGDESIEVALGNLMAAGVVTMSSNQAVSYPTF